MKICSGNTLKHLITHIQLGLFSFLLLSFFLFGGVAKAVEFEYLKAEYNFENNGNDLVGSLNLNEPPYGYATGDKAKFDSYGASVAYGTNVQYYVYSTPTSGLAISPNGYSFSYWIKSNSDGANINHFYWGYKGNYAVNSNWLWKFQMDQTGVHNIEQLPDDSSSCSSVNTNDSNLFSILNDGDWHFVTYTIGNSNIKIYIDGNNLAWDCSFSTYDYTGAYLQIYGFRNNGNVTTYFDDYALYNDIISNEDIEGIYNWGLLDNLVNTYSPSPTSCAPGYILNENNECWLNTDATTQGLFYFKNPYQCSSQSTCKISYLFDDNIFTPYDYISIYQYESPTSTTRNLIATSTIIDYSMFNKKDGSSYFLLTGTSTLSGLTYYDIEATLAESYNPITNTTTPATTTIPYMVIVDWSNYIVQDLNTWIIEQINSTTTANNDLEINTYAIACTDEQWATDTWWAQSFCLGKKAVLDFGVSAGEIAKKVAFSITAYIKGMFPFNVISNVSNSWNEAETATLTSEFNWINEQIGQDGTVYFNMPQFEGMATNSIAIYGSNVSEDNEFDNYQAMIRSLSTVILIGLFFWFAIIKRAERIYYRMKDEI